ncbi:UNVERIFIED_CONTAM: L,D-transpeptidase [Halobacillus marinus]
MKILGLVLLLTGPLFPPVMEDSVIIVNKATHELVLFKNSKPVFRADAAVGKTKDLTPEGIFSIKVKAEDPYYRKLDIPGGDPENPLGTRWIGFDARGTDGRMYGIHGTNRPDSIGKSVSAGCVRLLNEDVERLYELVPVEMDVVIVDTDADMKAVHDQWEKNKWKEMIQP